MDSSHGLVMDRPKGFEATCLALEIVPLRLVFGEKNVCLSDTGNNDGDAGEGHW